MSDDKVKNPFPVMENMTVKLVREYLQRKKSIILPLGVTEQHGYHLPLCTDALVVTHLARMIGEKTDILVAPTIRESFSGGGLEGTINISPTVMSLVVSDTLLSLVMQGFRNFYIILGHGGSENMRALDNALKMLLRNNIAFGDAMIVILPHWRFSTKQKKSFDDHDWHAGHSETSAVMAIAPELVRMQDMELDTEPLLKLQMDHPDNYQHAEKIVDDEYVVPRMGQRPDIKVGVMGRPEKASAEYGQKMVDETVEGVSRKILELESKADGVYKEVKFDPEPIIL